jgi:hypothetical protein
MKADEFSVWFSGVRRLSAGQRREVAAALANLDGGLGRAGETEASAAGGATDKGAKRGCRPDALGMSGWRVKAVRIARDEQSSPGAARMGFRGSAAGAVGAPGVATKNLPNYLGWRRALEAWGDQATPQTWIKGAIGNGPYQQVPL